jgi:ribosomal protein L16/L10AE
MMFEVSGVDASIAKVALLQAAYKLPMKCQVVARTE